MGVVLAMLLAVVASGYVVRLLPIALPLPLMQIGLGALIASLGWHPVRLEPHTFFKLGGRALAAPGAIDMAGNPQPFDEKDADIHASAAEQVRGLYQHRLGGSSDGTHPARVRVAEEAERHYRLAALAAERKVLQQMARKGRLSDETARRLVQEIDLVEARYRSADDA